MEQGGGRNTAWRGSLKTYHIKQTSTKLYSPWQNRAEGEIRETKRDIKKMTPHANSPRRQTHMVEETPIGSYQSPAAQ
jgi:hypothetical protein